MLYHVMLCPARLCEGAQGPADPPAGWFPAHEKHTNIIN